MTTTKYKALALDLDGTLTNSEKKISKRNKSAVKEAIDKGVTVILASGRPLFGIAPVADKLDMLKRSGYILAYNGGCIVDCKTGEIVYSRELPKNCTKDICDIATQNGVYAVTYYDNKIVSESDTDEYVLKEARCNNAEIKKVDSLKTFVNYSVPKFLVVGEHSRLLSVRDALLALYKGAIDCFFSEDYFLEVVPANVAKDNALDELLCRLGITSKELVACGDGMNDIPMLSYAGLGVAMDNAYPEVKEYADYIGLSNDNDGVAEVIEKFILNSK